MVYYINCDHRVDRRSHIEGVLSSLNLDKKKFKRIPGDYIPSNGSLGCVNSHILIMNDIKKNSYENCIILEDDFIPYDIETFNSKLKEIIKSDLKWDIIMLSANLIETIQHKDNLLKVIKAQTSSGYCINIKFVDNLLISFNESKQKLEQNMTKDEWALDQNWKKIQSKYNWFCTNPLLGKQIDGYSDIEQKNIDYRC